MTKNTLSKRDSSNLISSMLMILLAAIIWWISGSFPELQEGYPGPKLFPRIIALGFGGIGLVLAYSHYKTPFRNSTTGLQLGIRELLRPALAISIVAIFPIISPKIGFLLALLILSISMGFIFELQWWKAVLTGLITVGIIYLIFSQFLSVIL